MDSFAIGGIEFSGASLDEAVALVADRAQKGLPCLTVTPNATILHRAFHDEDFYRTLSRADLVLPDGVGVIWAAKHLKVSLKPQKIAGVDFGEALARHAAKNGLSLFLFGAKAGVAEDAKRNLMARYPALSVVGCRDGYGFSLESLAAEIEKTKASVVFCCLGSPLQEEVGLWLSKTLSRPVLCLGGSLDIYACRLRRAPKLFRRLSLEWLWRCLCEVRRFRGLSSLFGFLLDIRALKKRKRYCNRQKKSL